MECRGHGLARTGSPESKEAGRRAGAKEAGRRAGAKEAGRRAEAKEFDRREGAKEASRRTGLRSSPQEISSSRTDLNAGSTADASGSQIALSYTPWRIFPFSREGEPKEEIRRG